MFDTIRFLQDNFNAPAGVINLLGAYRLPAPPQDTVRKWFSRGNIPSEWLPVLVSVLELDNGQPVSLIRYLGSTQDAEN